MNSENLQLTPGNDKVLQLTPEERQRIEEIANQINLQDSQFLLEYGVAAQGKIAEFTDYVLQEVRVKDTGYVGEILTDLMFKVKDLDINAISLDDGNSFLSKLPFLSNLVDSAERFMARYQKISVQIEKIVEELDKSKMELLKDVTMLDGLYNKNFEYYGHLNLYILAGELKLKELQEKLLPEMKLRAENSRDQLAAQQYNDLIQAVHRFEKKVHDLKLSRMVSLQTAPQIRLIQNNNQILVEKIQSSLLNTIPLWKNQVVIAISLFRQNKALEMQKEVSETTNELLLKNAELLKETSLGVAGENEKGIVEIETLKKVNADLLSTIEEIIKIHQEGRLKRQQAESELAKMEADIKNKLVNRT